MAAFVVGENPDGSVIVDPGDGSGTFNTTREQAEINGLGAAPVAAPQMDVPEGSPLFAPPPTYADVLAAAPAPEAPGSVPADIAHIAAGARPPEAVPAATPGDMMSVLRAGGQQVANAAAQPTVLGEADVLGQSRPASVRTPGALQFNTPQQTAPGSSQGPARFAARGGRRGGGGRVRMPGPSESQQRFLDTFQQDADAAQRSADAVRDGQEQRNATLGRANIQDATLEQEAAEAEAGRQETLQRAEQSLGNMRQALSARRVDPQAFWRDRGAEGRVSAALAIAVGEFGKVLTGSNENTAMSIIDDAVEKNIEAQAEALARDERLLSGSERELGRLMDGFEDERQREAAARVAHWDQIERQLQAVTANVQDEQTLANTEAALAEITRRKETAGQQFEAARQQAAAQAARRRAAAARRRLNTITLPGGIEMQLNTGDPEKLREQLEIAQQAGVDIGPYAAVAQGAAGSGLEDIGETARNYIGRKEAASRDVLDALRELRAIHDQYGGVEGETMNREVVARAQALRWRAARGLGTVEDAGAFGDQEAQLYLSRIPDPTSTELASPALGSEIGATFSALEESVSGSVRNAYTSYGVEAPDFGDTSTSDDGTGFTPAGGR